MLETTKNFIAKTGLAVGVGVGSLMGAQSMEADNPHKPDVEWVGQVTLAGSAFAVARRGILAFSINSLEKDAIREQAEIEKLKTQLPEIEEIRDSYHFFNHLKEHEPRRAANLAGNQLIRPVLSASELNTEINPFMYETLIMTVEAMRKRMELAESSDAHQTDMGEVIEAGWFLDQTFPISMNDEATPEAKIGEKHWFDFVYYSIPREEIAV